MAKKFMIGNWKMNQSLAEIQSFFDNLNKENLQGNFFIAPQSLHISSCKNISSQIKIAAQNISQYDSGAYTGEISSDALAELGIDLTIIGHSERRSIYGETDLAINQKAKKAIEKNITPVICIGESLEQREAGLAFSTVLEQLEAALSDVKIKKSDDLIIAYEPVWAIGTGKTATSDQAEEVHQKIRKYLKQLYGELGENISILYGGSVKPNNIEDLLSKPNINGGLVGGASLKAESFALLCKATLQ